MSEDRYAKKWQAMIGIGLLSFVVFMDFGLANTILPGIQADLQATVNELQWVMNAFAMMLAMFVVTMGRLGDIYGRRMVLYIGTVVFGLSSVLAGAAPGPEILIVARVVQGISGAIGMTCAVSLVMYAFPEEEHGRALGIFMAITAAGLAVGPVIGGVFLSLLSWRWAFFINIPITVLGFLVARGAVAETPRLLNEKVDWLGLCFLIPGIGCLTFFIMQGNSWGWFSPVQIALYAVTIIAVIGLIMVESRAKFPIIDMKLLKIPMVQFSLIGAIGMGGFISLGTFLPPLFLVSVQNQPGYIAGLMLLSITAMVMIVPPLIGKSVDRRGPVPFVIAGQFAMVIAAVTQVYFVAASPAWFVILGLALFGLGWGLQQGSSLKAATMALPQEAAGVAVGTMWTVLNIAKTLTVAIGGLILTTTDHARLEASLAAANITLSDHQQHIIRSLLSDPSQAQQVLGELPADLDTEIAPLFHESFMAGYSGAMWFMAAVCALCLIGLVLLSFRVRAAERWAAGPEA
ncbi:MAG: MFS transporter [Pseudomonadota bacterium]